MPVENLDLSRIRIDGGTQARVELDLDAVEDYAERLRDGETPPPIVCFFDGSTYWLGDGFHRLHAARKAGRASLPCDVRTGTLKDAVWHAAGANKGHGVRMTRKDMRKAVEIVLKANIDRSNVQIAEWCGVDEGTVRNARGKLTSEFPKSTTRTGKDGRVINTANIGKRPEPAPVPRPEPKQEASGHTPSGTSHAGGDLPGKDHLSAKQPVARIELPVSNPQSAKLQGYITLDRWTAADQGQREAWLNVADSESRFNSQGDNENIEWALWSWNPVTGCRHDCPYCYARDIAERFYEQKFEPSFWPERLLAPRNTPFPEEKALRWIGHKNVFTCSMADLFGRWVPGEWIEAVLQAVREAPQWNFLFLTKFPNRMAEFDFPMNAWVGTTVDCQARVANAEKAFRKIRAGVKWLSCEPLIEPLKFRSLEMFDWLVIGGASRSAQTPEWHPPRPWVEELERMAREAGCKVYEKSNLLERIREYPGGDVEGPPTKAPEALRYLPEVVA